jgi:ATP-dependent exoDNAse (exonuclease V) beta subunit
MAEYNPRQISDEELEKLANSMEAFGVVEPIVVNKNPERIDVVIGGHQRLKVSLWKKSETVPTIEVNLSPDKEKALNLALNKISGVWDQDKLKVVLNDLKQIDDKLFDITGFVDKELQELEFFDKDEYRKQEFSDIVDKFTQDTGQTKKDENWFYVEFYGQNEKFAEISKLLKPHMKGNSKHEIQGEVFANIVKTAINLAKEIQTEMVSVIEGGTKNVDTTGKAETQAG